MIVVEPGEHGFEDELAPRQAPTASPIDGPRELHRQARPTETVLQPAARVCLHLFGRRDGKVVASVNTIAPAT